MDDVQKRLQTVFEFFYLSLQSSVTDCFLLQSAALQKKLHHMEVQLNNEKQIRDDLEHKYRYWSCRNIT